MDNQKVVLITGCSSGFGLLTAVRLASRGHFVWATMRDLSKKQDLENELAKHKAKAAIRQLDVTKPETIKNVVAEIQKNHFHIDVLINNAGFGMAGFFEDLTQDEIREVMDTNFFGVQNTCREVLPLMRERRQGKIINISSIAGQTATPCLGAYNSSKWALEAFSESLYYEMSLFGVSVVLVEPGSYPTKIFTANARYAKRFEDAQSPYFKVNQRIKDLAPRFRGNKDPERVAGLIEDIINDPKPKLRYISDFESWFRVKVQQKLPHRLMAGIFRRMIYADR